MKKIYTMGKIGYDIVPVYYYKWELVVYGLGALLTVVGIVCLAYFTR